MKSEAKHTIRLSIPIILGELAQMALHILDTAMVGALGYKQLAAASLVFSVLNIPLVLGIGITLAVSQMVSLAKGQNDRKLVSHYFYNGFWICLIASIIISLLISFGSNILYHLNQDPEVVELAIPFLHLMGWSVIPMMLFMALKQFTDGLELTRTAMLLSFLLLPVNAFLNWLFIYGNWGFPRLELEGAGWGTLITRTLIFIVLAIIILYHKRFRSYIAVRYSEWKFNWQTIKRLLHIGIPSGLQVGLEAGAFAISGIIIGTINAQSQAAHQIALVCASTTFMLSMGLAQGGSIRTSNALGAKNWHKINLIGKSTLIIALTYGVLCAIGFFAFRNVLPHLFTSSVGDTSVIAMASGLLIYAAIFQISDSTQAISAGLLRGIKDVKVPTLVIVFAYWVVGIPFGCWLAFNQNFGAVGIWLGFIIGLTISSIFLTWRFFRIIRQHHT